MNSLPPRRGILSRADLVAALAAAEGGRPDATALIIADAIGLEWVSPLPKPRADKTKRDVAPQILTPPINQAPLLETRFWRVEEAEFFSDPDTPEPPTEITVFEKWRNPPKTLPRFQPLSVWAELAPRLRKVLSQYREGRAIDLSLTVRQISRGHLLERFPRERRRRWGPALLLIEDDSHRLVPFRDDKHLVRRAIQSLLPRHSLLWALMDEQRTRPERLGQGQADWPPLPGTLVLALSDLGCFSRADERLRQRWLDIGKELQKAGCHPIALFPGPLGRCMPELAGVWQLVPWERPRPDDGCTGDERAERLLRLLAPASRITPGLLRAVRLLLPEAQADAGTESDVWQHGDFNSHWVVPSLVPERALALRRELASQPGEAARALRARLIRCLKGFRFFLQPEIWFDEVLNFDPSALDSQELAEDREDAQAYFAAFCDANPDLSNLSMPGGDRAWFLRVKARSPELLWYDEKVGKRLAQLALALEPDGAPPAGIGARDIPHGGRPECKVYLVQRGSQLAFNGDAAQSQGLGSALGQMPNRNGLVEITLDDNTFWESGQPPSWAEAWGWDEFGAWVEFSVRTDSAWRYEGTVKHGRKDSQRVTQRMRWIEPGSFLMGSPATEAERFDWEGPQHEVNIKEGYWLFDTACTQALWEVVMGNNPSRFNDEDGKKPVEQVSWDDAQKFILALNQKMPGLDLGLPTEAQWEYACRAGTTTPFSFGDNITPEQVNYNGNYPYTGGKQGLYRQETVPVKSLPANPWGLHEMHGNVREWVQDAWHGNYNGAPTDGSVWESAETGAARVVRGGSWYFNARLCRSACRYYYDPVSRGNGTGFRCARVQGREPGKQEAGRGKADAERSGASLPRPRPAAPVFDRSHALRGNAADGAPRQEIGRNKPAPAGVSGKLTGSQAGAWEPARLLRLDTTPVATAPLPQCRAFVILTDCERLTVRQIVKPSWAKSMGRDRFGLWADIAVEANQGEPVIQRLRWIPPGRFMMGSPDKEPGRWSPEGPQHPVTISQGYWLFDTPCPQALWEAVMPSNPSYFKSPLRPVEQVSWDDAKTFLQRINEKYQGLALALPSEAQWEYACRAGTEGALYTGGIEILGERNAPALDPIAWYGGNSGEGYELPGGYDSSDWKAMQYQNPKSGTREVGQKQPNPWGLYDMLGNVWEWVEDPWHSNYELAPMDGSVWQSDEAGAARVVRGGSWYYDAWGCRSACRHYDGPGGRGINAGFRCARVQA